MKKVLMVAMLGMSVVLFANEADNASAKKKYYLINFDRYAKIFKSTCKANLQRCELALKEKSEEEIPMLDKNSRLIPADVRDIKKLYLSSPKDMEFYNSLRKDFQVVYDYVEE